jgi:uncharacterized protein (UPF0261 family)/ABC-type branched-subunit amino acid transport system ATPase component
VEARLATTDHAALTVETLHVFYGASHALQGVSLSLPAGVLAVVGRNGMGKTTLCNAIMGLVPARDGHIRIAGREARGLAPNTIARLGVGYVPQGRRVFPSLTVDETLRLARRGRDPAWTVERVYEAFPRLHERRRNGGAQLSGGEQQMLAIGRALLGNPRLLVMDEPTEGLAPVIVEQVAALMRDLAAERSMAVLLIEQNLGVALAVAERVAIMVNGRIAREMAAEALAADADLQQRLLGVGRHAHDETDAAPAPRPASEQVRSFAIVRPGEVAASADAGFSTDIAPTRFGTPPAPPRAEPKAPPARQPRAAEPQIPVADLVGRTAYVVGTFDTKGAELFFIRNRLAQLGISTRTVDLATTGRPSTADISAQEVARHHPDGAQAVFSNDRGGAVAAMATAFAKFIGTRRDIGGIISAGGSGGTSLATPAMQRLPVGVPKVMISTVASGDVKRYVGPTDICMMYAVTDVQGINRISERVLGNGAHALAGMIAHMRRDASHAESKPAIGLTMFGVTTPCVQLVQKALADRYDCLVFHATGTGGESFEKLVDSGLLSGALDITTTEVPDLLVGGVFPAHADRFGAFARARIPYVGSLGACDMVNFGAMETVPEKFRGRTLYVHNPSVTLMRTTAEECAAIGAFIGERLNRMLGPVRVLIPEKGVSLIDVAGKPFHDPAANRALFDAVTKTFRPGPDRRIERLPYELNDPSFAAALVRAFEAIALPTKTAPGARSARAAGG